MKQESQEQAARRHKHFQAANMALSLALIHEAKGNYKQADRYAAIGKRLTQAFKRRYC